MNKKKNPKHLAYIRTLPCATCQALAPSEACHIRYQNDGGMGTKPSDFATIPQCHECHMKSHEGQLSFWGGEDGIEKAKTLALALWTLTGDWGRGVRIVLKFRRRAR